MRFYKIDDLIFDPVRQTLSDIVARIFCKDKSGRAVDADKCVMKSLPLRSRDGTVFNPMHG
jgi:hypothetical protein